MGKDKLKRFAEMRHWGHVFQPPVTHLLEQDFELKGQWANYFGNDQPLVLELGCGKGEYTIGLSQRFPAYNFLGIDIKGARMYQGARSAMEMKLSNVAFIRARIEFIPSFFSSSEVSEIWITFPDPFPRPSDAKNRLISAKFLNLYRRFVRSGGLVHLKTDSELLMEYGVKLLEKNQITPEVLSWDIQESHSDDALLGIHTHYESQFRKAGVPIKYLRFVMNQEHSWVELPKEKLTEMAFRHEIWKKERILKPRLP